MGSSALDTVLLMCISLVFSKKEGPTLLLANLCLRWFYHFLIRFHIEFINGSGSLSRRTLATEITFSWMRFLFDVYTEKLVLSSPINLPWIFFLNLLLLPSFCYEYQAKGKNQDFRKTDFQLGGEVSLFIAATLG